MDRLTETFVGDPENNSRTFHINLKRRCHSFKGGTAPQYQRVAKKINITSVVLRATGENEW